MQPTIQKGKKASKEELRQNLELATSIAEDLLPKRQRIPRGEPEIHVTPVNPEGGPPKAQPKAAGRRTREQAKVETILLDAARETEDPERTVAKRRRRWGRAAGLAVPGT